jgi:hypothetical protein
MPSGARQRAVLVLSHKWFERHRVAGAIRAIVGRDLRAVADRAEDCGDHGRPDLVLWQARGSAFGARRVSQRNAC